MDPEDVPREQFRQWAESNGWEVMKTPDEHTVVATNNAGKEIHLVKYGNVLLRQFKLLSGENGRIEFGEKRMTVVEGDGTEHRVSNTEWPINHFG